VTDVSTVRPNRISRGIATLLTLPIKFYQTWISPMSGPTCRYYPSCSHYAVGALTIHGPVKGLLLGAWRICRCHPWTPGGVDLVPALGKWRSEPSRAQSEFISDTVSTGIQTSPEC
jgi:putative membrane protein insertion efficiency factor